MGGHDSCKLIRALSSIQPGLHVSLPAGTTLWASSQRPSPPPSLLSPRFLVPTLVQTETVPSDLDTGPGQGSALCGRCSAPIPGSSSMMDSKGEDHS